ncbi:MAG TPA: sigma-54 dependent transcriptional regulator [Rhodocyclaceae bacterium]|nr:sigma-54 dependent transcriptional regulator [Rhodocyclaceae bacterium]
MLPSRPSLLIVDDDPLILDTLSYVLSDDFTVVRARHREDAISKVRGQGGTVDVALIDLGLPPVPHRPDEGLALIGELLAHDPLCKIVVLSGQNEEANARHARTLGALEFVAKPAQPETLRAVLKRAADLRAREHAEKNSVAALDRIVGMSVAIDDVKDQLRQFARSRFPVLIEGESGSGKEVAANALHQLGPWRDKPFVALNCAAIAPGLIEATLFGHGRGAFTGAVGMQNGYFEEAGEGILFLDEIGELPLDLQPKLLRVLENGEYQRVGETQKRQVHARVIAATNRDLRQEVRANRFRADLFHRLSVLRLRMPALRDMGNDRIVLLDHYLREYSKQMSMPPFMLDTNAVARWVDYDFPGNVRELRNVVVRLLSRHGGRSVSRAALEDELEDDVLATDDASISGTSAGEPIAEAIADNAFAVLKQRGSIDLDATLRRAERDYIVAALRLSRGNMSQAARMLGINRSTLYNRMETLARFGEAVSEDAGD